MLVVLYAHIITYTVKVQLHSSTVLLTVHKPARASTQQGKISEKNRSYFF